jgi:hypothetical protein
MSGKELKQAFHKLIDEVDDEQLLKDVYSILNQHKMQKRDIIDDLTESQKARLYAAMKQADEGKTISNEEAQRRIKTWLSK